jgi:hypothetical protein
MPPQQPWTSTECTLLAYYTTNNNQNLRRLHLTYGTVGEEIMKEIKYLRGLNEARLELPAVDRAFTERTVASKVLRMRKKGEVVVGKAPVGPERRRVVEGVRVTKRFDAYRVDKVSGDRVEKLPMRPRCEYNATNPSINGWTVKELDETMMYIDPRKLQKDFKKSCPNKDIASHTSPSYSEHLAATPFYLSKVLHPPSPPPSETSEIHHIKAPSQSRDPRALTLEQALRLADVVRDRERKRCEKHETITAMHRGWGLNLEKEELRELDIYLNL